MIGAWWSLSVHTATGILWALGTLVGELVIVIVACAVVVSDAGNASTLLWSCIPLMLLTSVAVGTAGWAWSQRTFEPLRDAVTRLDDLDDGHVDERIAVPDAPDERRLIVEGVNALLDRIQAGFADGSRFAANASHELRTPLSASRAIIQVALKTPRDEDTMRVLDRLLQVNGRMIGITEALLDLATAENQLTRSSVELRTLVADAIALLEPEITARRLRLHLRLDDVVVTGHDALLRQLVTNLIRNAIVHNVERGSLAVTLHAGAVPVLAIENDGAILDPEELPGLLQPFARRESRTHATAGSGLGLAIAARIVVAHEADLALTARPRGGLIAQVSFAAG